MDPGVKRIGDVIIERVGSEKKSKDEDPSTIMNTDTDSLSDSQSSDDELIPDPPPTADLDVLTLQTSPASQSCDPSTSYSAKRKNEFTDVDSSHSKKTKTKYNDEESGSTTESAGGSGLGHTPSGSGLGHAAGGSGLGHAACGSGFGRAASGSGFGHAASGSGFGRAAVQEAGLLNSEVQIENSVNLDGVSDEIDKSDLLGDASELKSDILSRTRLHSDNEDSEYDSEEESDGEEAAGTSKLDPVASVLDTEKTDFIEKLASELGESSSQKSEDKLDGSDYDYDITEKLKEMGEISVETVKKGDKPRKSDTADSTENEISVTPAKRDSGSDSDDKNSSERKIGNMRRNIREVMDETQLDEATLAAQRQEMERLRRVQEQQKIIREVQRQIALNRQNNKTQHRVISLLQGNSSIIKQMPGTSGSTTNRIGGTVLVKLPNGETKPMTRITKGQTPFEVVRLQKGALQGKVQRNLIPMKKAAGGNLTPSVSIAPVTKKIEPKTGDTDSETETSDAEKIVKKVAGKPKDVVTISSSSDDDCIVLSEDEPEEPEPDEDPCNSGMHTNDSYNVPDEQGRVLINVGHPENETDIHLAPQIARVIKPHQIGGVRFLFDNVIESTERFSTSTGFGCILAHSMGLGKTLQVVCFSDIFLRHTPAKTILCIMPINTLQNWMAEYNMWLPKEATNSPLLSHGEVRPRNFNLYVLNDSHKTLAARAKVIQEWHKDGGVLLIGYELYRLLSLRRNPKPKSKRKKMTATLVDKPDTPETDDKNKSLFEEIHEALVTPGPDLVICDEGHRIKNSHASISHALKQIRSKRRIVLTGYPLQNNLLEYWCMVDFVRPNYLGTKTEFSNMFERPIQNGQCIDSTPQDIRLMRYRAHVLHSLLEGFVQRRSHAVLQTSLPQKEEYVLLVRMTEFQRKLYDTFMNEVVRTKTVPNPLKAFAVCCKIWNHPDVLYYFLKKHTQGEAVDIDLEEVAGTATSTAANGSTPATPKKGSSRSKGGAKKEKKTAASKSSNATTASPNNAKPAASVTPNTNAPTPLTNPPVQPNAPNIPNQLNIPNPAHPNQPMSNPAGLQNPPNYGQPNPNYPGPPYPNQHMPYSHQNYPQYPQNGDYYNQNQGYPNNYNPGYYPNQEYGGFYENKPDGYPQSYQHDNQNYWQPPQPGNQYGAYNQNGPQNDYYGNMQAQPHAQPGYGGNQDYYRQNQYNQGYPQNNVYQANNTSYPQNQQWPQPQQVQPQVGQQVQSQPVQPPQQADVKSEFKTDGNTETRMNVEVKEECGNKMTPITKTSDAIEQLDNDESKVKTDTKDEDKKNESTEQSGTKEETDEKVDKDGEAKPGEVVSSAVTKVNVKEDPGIPYDWAQELMKGYIPGCMENSAKMEVFFCILQESMALGDRILLFSQSLFTLNLIEEFLQRSELPGTTDKWARNKNYYRLDGSTSALEREKLINEYNSNPNIHLFLVSTRAGSLGINLVGANRVIVFDASWNPCHDTQAVCRVYRYGQKKPCFVYRIVMDNCLEKKIYDRQINKQGMADRVVDECNPDAHLSMKEVTNLCWDDEKDTEVKDFSTTKDKYIDVVMQKVLDAYSSRLSKEPFQHESLLIDRKEKKLSQAEKRLAKRSYELEKQANINSRPTYSYYNNGTGQGLQIRAIRTQDGMLQNKPVASVRPMQSEQMVRDIARPGGTTQGRSRWIPAEVWQRQGMTAQEMTLPLDVVIPTNSPDRGSIVLKAGQKVLVLKSPKGIYMQLECGKIVAIKTAFKVRGGKAPEKGEEAAGKETPAPTTILKKIPQVANTSKTTTGNVPLPLKNNSAITVIPKGGQQRVVKPFTQSVTKLNMRSIRQPVPNLVGRQIPVKMGGGPRFTGKIQSVHRKVQLAKAKPYNLDKSGDPLKAMDPSSIKNEPSDREDQETHIVPSSDEEIPLDQQVDASEKKDDDSGDAIECNEAEMFSESEKSMETDLERLSNAEFPDSNQIDRRQSTDSYQSSEKHSSSDGFTNLDRFPGAESFSGASEQFQNMDKYPMNTEKYQNLEKFPINTDKYPNLEKYPPNTEKYPNAEKYPSNTEKYPNAEKYPNTDKYPNAEKYPNTEKYPERNPNVEKYPLQEKFGIPERFDATENFADRYPQAEKYPGYPERFPNPVGAEKFSNQERFTGAAEKFPNATSMTEKFSNAASTVERYPNPAASTERYPNASTENFAFSNTEKFTNPDRFGQSEKFTISVSSIERYPNPAASTEKYPNSERFGQVEKFPNTERFGQNQQQPEKFPNTERYPQQQPEKFPNPERYPQQQQPEKFPSTERYPQQQQPEKFPNTERYPQQQQPEKFPSTERYPQQQQPEKFPNPERYPQQQQPEKFPNPERYPQQQQPEKFPSTERYPQQQPEKFVNPERYPQQQPEKYGTMDKFPSQTPEKYPGIDKFAVHTTERYPAADQYQNPEKYPTASKYPTQPTYANMDSYPGVGSYQKLDTYQNVDKPKSAPTGKDSSNDKLKPSTAKDNRKDKSKQGTNNFMSTHNVHTGPNISHSGTGAHTVSNPVHTVANIAHNVSNSSYSISNISQHSGTNLAHAAPNLGHSGPNLSHTPLNSSHTGSNLSHSGSNAAHTASNVSHTGLPGSNSGHLVPNSVHSANPAHSISNPTHHSVATSIYSASNTAHNVSNPNYSVSNPNHSASNSTYSVSNPSHTVSSYSGSHTGHSGPNHTHTGSNLTQPGPILSHSVSNPSHTSSNMPQPGTNLSQPTTPNLTQPGGSTIPPQPPVVVHEQGNTSRSLKNYRHNFASQKAHNQNQNFGTTKSASKTTSATSSALHQLEQTTSSIGENKQPFQESLDNITNSYGAVPPTGGSSSGDQKAAAGEDSHIIDLDADKTEVEILEKPVKASSKSSSSQSHTTPAPAEPTKPASQPPQPVAQPANTKSDAPVHPQEYGGYNSYYGYSPHMQSYPQPQPGLPPQTFYNPPEPAQHYAEVKSSKVDKPPATVQQTSSTPAATPQSSRTTESTPAAEPTPAPSHHSASTTAAAAAGYTASPSGFAPYAQPAIPPPPPHGAYDMMSYPQQNQYSANYPGLPYPNQPSYQPPYQPPYQPDQAAGYPPAPAPNMYSAFHRPDVHQYAAGDPYAQPHYAMRNAYAHHQYPYASPAAAAAQGIYPPAPGAAPGYEYQYNANAFPPPPPPPAAFVNPYSGLPNNSPVP